MAASYYTIPLSDNIEETPEGFLVCRDAVLGRTGWQTYKVSDLPQEAAAELGIDLSNPNADIDLYRPANEVFSKDTLASIEGKTVTDDHPESEDGNVNPENFNQFARGHVQNVRRGKERLDNGDEPIIGDVHITAEPLLSEVKNRQKRELSLGYDYQIRRNGDRIEMHHIVANHCAVVPRGRAGREARINDSEPSAKKSVASRDGNVIIQKTGEGKRMKLTWKTIFGAGLKAHAADAEPEELADAAVEMAEKHMDKNEAEDKRRKDRHMDDRKAKGRTRDRMHDCLDRCMDGKADDADLEEMRSLLNEFFEEEEEEPEHQEDKARDRKAKDRKADDRHMDDSEESEEEEAEQPVKVDVKDLRKTLAGDKHEDDEDQNMEPEDEDEDDEEEDSAHEDDEDEDQNKPVSEDWKEGEPEENDFEKTSDKARDKRAHDKPRGRAHDGAIEILKALRPVAARTKDKNVRRAYDSLVREVARSSKPRSGGYATFAARARAHDSSSNPSTEAQQAQELDSIFAKARNEGRK